MWTVEVCWWGLLPCAGCCMILPPPLPLLLSPVCLNSRSECETNPERVVAWLPKSDLSFRLALSVPVPWVEQTEMEVNRKQSWEASQGAWRPAGSSCLLQAAPVVESLQCAQRWVSALEGREHWLLYPEEVESRGLEWFGKGWATSTSRVGMQIQVQWAPKTCPWTPRACHLSRNISWVSSSSEPGDFSQMSCLKTHSSLPLAPHLFSLQFLCTSFPEWILWSLFCHYCLPPQESAAVHTNPLALRSRPCAACLPHGLHPPPLSWGSLALLVGPVNPHASCMFWLWTWPGAVPLAAAQARVF